VYAAPPEPPPDDGERRAPLHSTPMRAWVIAAVVLVALVALLVMLVEPSARPASSPPPVPEGPDETAEAPRDAATPTKPLGTIAPRASSPGDDAAAGRDGGAAPGSTISGEVLDPDGAPAREARVACFRLENGTPVSNAEAHTYVGREGRFTLTFQGSAPADGVVVAFGKGRRPSTVHLAGDPNLLLKLVLGEGATIEGVTVVDDVPAPGAIIGADIRPGTPGCFAGRHELWWSGGAFETKLAHHVSDDKGRFRIDGLARDVYLVDMNPRLVEKSVGIEFREHVRAPISGLRIGPRTGRLRIEVRADGQLLDLGRVAISDQRERRLHGPSKDMANVRVTTGVQLTVDAASPGFLPARAAVPPLAAGETRDVAIALDRAPAVRLELTLRGAEAMKLDRVHVRLIPLKSGPPDENRALDDIRRTRWAIRKHADLLVLEHVPHAPGAYLLVARNWDSWAVPVVEEVSVPSEGTITVAAEAVAGGKIEVLAVGPDGTKIPATAVVRNARGIDLVRLNLESGWHVPAGRAAPADAKLEALELVREMGILAPGTYDLQVDAEGHRSVLRQTKIKAGESTMETVTLEPGAK
jgi:hypothetical protein